MDLLFKYNQEKSDKYNSKSICDLKLFYDGTTIIYDSLFDFEYLRYGNKKRVLFHHNLSFSTITGDVTVTYKIINDNLTNEKSYNNKTKTKKNDFSLLFELTDNGFIRGEKRIGYWGVKYHRAQDTICETMMNILRPKFTSPFLKDKGYDKPTLNRMYDMLVDFHLDCKKIKSHDGIYYDIQNDYPKKKWLMKNDYKFLPAVLDSYGIKSRYLIGELNRYEGKPIHISSLNYLCKLFGDNYIDYIKKIVWENHCFDLPPNKKIHQLKNESEKDCMVKTINNWETETLKSDTLIYSLNKLFTIRDLLESKKIDLKYKAKNDNEFENHMDTWLGYKLHFARGYKVRYSIPTDVIDDIEMDIVINGETYKPNILLTEDDYRVEGYVMKNCMAKQFPHGSVYIFISLHHGRKRINLQYRKGNLIQSYGKANTAVPDLYDEVIEILTQRMKKHHDIEWKKEKYDFLTY
jgi:hypothetical protein